MNAEDLRTIAELADLPMSLLVFIWVVRETREMRAALLAVLQACLDKLE